MLSEASLNLFGTAYSNKKLQFKAYRQTFAVNFSLKISPVYAVNPSSQVFHLQAPKENNFTMLSGIIRFI